MMADDTITMNQDVPIMSINTDFQEHSWVQHGNVLHCEGGCQLVTNTNASNHGTTIPSGRKLVRVDGRWDIVDEVGEVHDQAGYEIAQAIARKQMALH